MIFDFLSWLYISLICLLWGNLFLKWVIGIDKTSEVEFPIACFIGMSVIAVIALYLSLILPLSISIKLAFQLAVLSQLLIGNVRKRLVQQLKKSFNDISRTDIGFMISGILMILFLSSSPIIHPDTLNYHAFSSELFDRVGTIKGIANLKPEFGFQSIWFVALAFFDIRFKGSTPLFLLQGCVSAWTIIFLIAKSGLSKNKEGELNSDLIHSRAWYLLLVFFFIISWTQIRLTASSLSPDFVATISIILGFYFFCGKPGREFSDKYDILAVFFSVIAVTIKLFAIPVLCIPAFICIRAINKANYTFAVRVILFSVLLLAPVIFRSILSTGYPFYPSTFGAIIPTNWRVNEAEVLNFQKYITSYARFPIFRSDTFREYKISIIKWLPEWWTHLYLVDKATVVVVALGAMLNICFYRIPWKLFNYRTATALSIAILGSVFWFVEAPDPRFGTGFLLPLIYLLYSPYVRYYPSRDIHLLRKLYRWSVQAATLFILIYIGYRVVYFFRPEQFIFPEGLKNISDKSQNCDQVIKRMVMEDLPSNGLLPDSCIRFRFLGSSPQQGFGPLP
jgi:hypothetical protein